MSKLAMIEKEHGPEVAKMMLRGLSLGQAKCALFMKDKLPAEFRESPAVAKEPEIDYANASFDVLYAQFQKSVAAKNAAEAQKQAALAENAATAARANQLQRAGYSPNRARFIAGLKMPGRRAG